MNIDFSITKKAAELSGFFSIIKNIFYFPSSAGAGCPSAGSGAPLAF